MAAGSKWEGMTHQEAAVRAMMYFGPLPLKYIGFSKQANASGSLFNPQSYHPYSYGGSQKWMISYIITIQTIVLEHYRLNT